jgi:hypothetical protein
MYPVIIWVLMVLGPNPYALETHDTNQACQQALNDYTPPPSVRGPRQILKCRMRTVWRHRSNFDRRDHDGIPAGSRPAR